MHTPLRPTLDLHSDDLLIDPYPTYARLRADPVVAFASPSRPHVTSIVLSRYADVQRGLRDPRFGRGNFAEIARANLGDGPLTRTFVKWMSFRDPPDHTRLRRLVAGSFTPRAVEGLRSIIDDTVDELLAPLANRATFDLIADFAYPLPVRVICELLGVPSIDRERFGAWSAALASGLDVTRQTAWATGDEAAAGMTSYFRDLIAERRHQSRDDLLSVLIRAEEATQFSGDELLATCVLLFFAGHETTVNLIGNGMLALLRNPDQLRLLHERPDIAPSAVEELLRFDSPVQRTGRIALTDVDLGDGRFVRAGQSVTLLIGAANRDTGVLDLADQLLLLRSDAHRHLAFGAGIHYCVGAPLARLEAQVALPRLLRRLVGLELTEQTPSWRPTYALRGLASLPVTLESVRRSSLPAD